VFATGNEVCEPSRNFFTGPMVLGRSAGKLHGWGLDNTAGQPGGATSSPAVNSAVNSEGTPVVITLAPGRHAGGHR
jgi:hypothetical protein